MGPVAASDMKQRITARSLNAYRRLRREVYIWDTEQHAWVSAHPPKGRVSWLHEKWAAPGVRKVVTEQLCPRLSFTRRTIAETTAAGLRRGTMTVREHTRHQLNPSSSSRAAG